MSNIRYSIAFWEEVRSIWESDAKLSLRKSLEIVTKKHNLDKMPNYSSASRKHKTEGWTKLSHQTPKMSATRIAKVLAEDRNKLMEIDNEINDLKQKDKTKKMSASKNKLSQVEQFKKSDNQVLDDDIHLDHIEEKTHILDGELVSEFQYQLNALYEKKDLLKKKVTMARVINETRKSNFALTQFGSENMMILDLLRQQMIQAKDETTLKLISKKLNITLNFIKATSDIQYALESNAKISVWCIFLTNYFISPLLLPFMYYKCSKKIKEIEHANFKVKPFNQNIGN